MDLHISHTTRYTYDKPVLYALQRLHLRPQDNRMQRVKEWEITVEGGQLELSYDDHYGNKTDLVNVTRGTTELSVTARGIVETHDTAGVLGPVYGTAPLWHFISATPATEAGDEIRALANTLKTDQSISALHTISTAILDAVPYETGRTYSNTTAQEALTGAYGVCQDHAHILIAVARAAGMPARYVSGYLKLDQTEDQTASHAWAEVHLPDLGWVGFDVSNRISPDDRYARLAVGRDARDASPVRGMRVGAGDESLIVTLQVQQ
ncbi:transglutaminase family protein [Loktanella sp. SALINAS62]|uniref:transglutaminase family protein n=1 Tax=Loktanella sp. SALINAS62 TaxID=2706124 RepID=UPI001B8B3B19|nr:transglutaminase family protein [Loktanella sp. SALINAS62]MBS1302304.1 transglutaminase family protein [Loktanella sp. SALINAS62]